MSCYIFPFQAEICLKALALPVLSVSAVNPTSGFYCYSITVVCIFSPPLYPTLAKPTSLPCFLKEVPFAGFRFPACFVGVG